MTDHGTDARPWRSARLRTSLLAAAAATALLPAICAGSAAGASPAPGGAACTGGYVYWSNTLGPILKPGDGMIGRACQDGGDVNQKFITGASLPGMILVYRGYLYWANIAPIRNGAGTIGRARIAAGPQRRPRVQPETALLLLRAVTLVTARGEQRHARSASPRYPQGHGLVAATNWNRAG